MYKDITASLVAATRKVVEASSAKAANEAAQKEQYSNLSKSMRPAYEGSAPRNAQEISLLKEKAHTVPKTPKEKSLAALAALRARIASSALRKIIFASSGFSSRNDANASPNTDSTALRASGLPSLSLVCPSN